MFAAPELADERDIGGVGDDAEEIYDFALADIEGEDCVNIGSTDDPYGAQGRDDEGE